MRQTFETKAIELVLHFDCSWAFARAIRPLARVVAGMMTHPVRAAPKPRCSGGIDLGVPLKVIEIRNVGWSRAVCRHAGAVALLVVVRRAIRGFGKACSSTYAGADLTP